MNRVPLLYRVRAKILQESIALKGTGFSNFEVDSLKGTGFRDCWKNLVLEGHRLQRLLENLILEEHGLQRLLENLALEGYGL